MPEPQILPCDGCGQLAPPDHIARRLARLELATRYRPVHIHALLLGSVVPEKPSSYLYSGQGNFDGEAGLILSALQIAQEGKLPEAVLAEFQKRGLLLTHVLECPLETGPSVAPLGELIDARLPAVLVRIRRSLKPKRVIVVSRELEPIVGLLEEANLGCPVSRVDLETPASAGSHLERSFEAFRRSLAATSGQ
jgi:hypothetical protein